MSSRGSASVWLLLALLCAELSNSTRISVHVQHPVNYDMMESPGKFSNTQCVIRLIRTSYILSPLFLLWRKSFLFAFASQWVVRVTTTQNWRIISTYKDEKITLLWPYISWKKSLLLSKCNNSIILESLYPLFYDYIKCRRVFNLVSIIRHFP